MKLEEFRAKIENPAQVETLDAANFWLQHEDYIVQAKNMVGNPFFYPIYRHGDLYSFSPLALMMKKGTYRPNADAVRDLDAPNNTVSMPWLFIDRDIERLGAAPVLTKKIKDPAQFITMIADAMQKDVDLIEAQNPGKTNVLLVGGRDSLNLLLLNWKNPVVAYSAAPNTPLVAQFVKDNGLDIDVHELRPDEDPSLLSREIAEASTMVDLENWKWTPHLLQISDDLNKQAVFWKGQFADAFLTDYWRSYTHSRSKALQIGKKVYKRIARHMPTALVAPIDHFFLKSFAQAIFKRGAVFQGSHMGYLRSITDCLCASGYHGPNTAAVWTSGHFSYLTHEDIRPQIGDALHGRPVVYPTENPSPPPSESRRGLRGITHYEKAVAALGIKKVD